MPVDSTSAADGHPVERTLSAKEEAKAPPLEHARLSQRRLSPPQEGREQVLVFDGVGLWKTKFVGGDDHRTDPDGGR